MRDGERVRERKADKTNERQGKWCPWLPDGATGRRQAAPPEHQLQVLLVADHVVLQGEDQVSQGRVHRVVVKVFLVETEAQE